ncbi:MAG: DNA-directed RNA polymerase subunit omega [Mangrovibacterium sp.]
MDFKKVKAEGTTVPRNLKELEAETGNIYETVMILAKRANQISSEMKEELNQKLQEFASYNDNLEEVFENREQIEISKYYERLPKSTLVACEELKNHNIYHRNPTKE